MNYERIAKSPNGIEKISMKVLIFNYLFGGIIYFCTFALGIKK